MAAGDPDAGMAWKVSGWWRSGRLVNEVASSLAKGLEPAPAEAGDLIPTRAPKQDCGMTAVRIAASALSLTLAVGVLGCSGHATTEGAESARHAQFEPVGHHTRCPRTDRLHEASPDPRTTRTLVPSGPTSALICRYWGFDDMGREGTFAGTRFVTDAATVGRAVTRLDALRPLFRGPHTCPAFGDRSELIFFRYRHASDDPVRIVVDCLIPVTNGRLVMGGLAGLRAGDVHWLDESLV